MDKEKLQRYSWAIYLIIVLIGIIMIFVGKDLDPNDYKRDVLLNIGAGMVGVSIVFIVVDQLFLWTPQKDKEKQLEEKVVRATQLLEDAKLAMTDIQLYPTRSAVYEAGCLALKKYQWQRLRIFAPVGLWEKSETKKEWLRVVACHARKKNVKSVWGVFGLPPKERKNDPISYEQVIDNLIQARIALDVFNGMSNVELHFYPPFPASVGLGVLIFETVDSLGGELAFALSSQGDEETIDSGFGIDNRPLFLVAKQWFDDQIFLKATGKFILQELDTPLEQRWEYVIKNWYGKKYLEKFLVAWEEYIKQQEQTNGPTTD